MTNMKPGKRLTSIFLCIVFLCSLCFQNVFGAGGITVSAEISDKTLTISGSGVSSLKRVVSVSIINPEGKVINLNQIMAEADGSFEYSVVLSSEDVSGIYTVTVASRGNDEKATDTVYYLSEESMLNAALDINSACEISGSFETAILSVIEVLLQYGTELDIKEISEQELKNIAEVLIWLKTDAGYDFYSVQNVLNRAKTVFKQFAECNAVNLTGFLKSNSDILFESEELFEKYNSYSSANKRKINEALIVSKPYNDFAEIRKSLKNEVLKLAADVSVKKLYVEGDILINKISISGSGTLTAKRIITVKITAPDQSIANLNQIKAEKDGTFKYSAELSTEGTSGIYTVEVFSRGIDEISEFTVFYLSEADRTKITNTINIANVNEIETVLKKNKGNMGISYLTDGEIKSIAIVLSEQKPSGGYGYNDIFTVINETKNLTDKLAKVEWLTLDKLIRENNSVLLYNSTEYDKYSSLKEASRNKICKEILLSSPFVSIKDFREAFEKAVSAFKESATTGGAGGSGGGGGGGGGSSSGGSSSGGNIAGGIGGLSSTGAFGAIEEYKTPKSPAEAFDDIKGFEWAKESIEGLYAKEIISPAENGKFRPSDSITREEFIKLMVCAFSLIDDSAECDFSDTEKGNWYYPYVASALKCGITNGKDDGRFGIGENIIRQDMAVLAIRTVESLGYKLNESSAEIVFSDAGEIADYAKDAVSLMQKSGIINGDDTGNFRPSGNASRAEAAKIIYMLLKAVNK